MIKKPERKTIEMADGRVYFSDDNWHTVWKRNIIGIGGARKVTGKEADIVRLLAVYHD